MVEEGVAGAGRHRPGDGARLRPPDGAAQDERPRRPRRAPGDRRDARARSCRRTASSLRRSCRRSSRRAAPARSPARASTAGTATRRSAKERGPPSSRGNDERRRPAGPEPRRRPGRARALLHPSARAPCSGAAGADPAPASARSSSRSRRCGDSAGPSSRRACSSASARASSCGTRSSRWMPRWATLLLGLGGGLLLAAALDRARGPGARARAARAGHRRSCAIALGAALLANAAPSRRGTSSSVLVAALAVRARRRRGAPRRSQALRWSEQRLTRLAFDRSRIFGTGGRAAAGGRGAPRRRESSRAVTKRTSSAAAISSGEEAGRQAVVAVEQEPRRVGRRAGCRSGPAPPRGSGRSAGSGAARITSAAKKPRIGSAGQEGRRVAFARRRRVRQPGRREEDDEARLGHQQSRVRIGLWSAPAMSRVGRTRKTAGATTAPKKSGGAERPARAPRRWSGEDEACRAGRRASSRRRVSGSGAYSAVTARQSGPPRGPRSSSSCTARRPSGAVAPRPGVDVHADEPVGLLPRSRPRA